MQQVSFHAIPSTNCWIELRGEVLCIGNSGVADGQYAASILSVDYTYCGKHRSHRKSCTSETGSLTNSCEAILFKKFQVLHIAANTAVTQSVQSVKLVVNL